MEEEKGNKKVYRRIWKTDRRDKQGKGTVLKSPKHMYCSEKYQHTTTNSTVFLGSERM